MLKNEGNQILKDCQSLQRFFKPKYQNETSEEEEEPAMTPTEQAAPASVTTVSGSGEERPVSETQPHDPAVSEIGLSDDPALWPEKITDQQRCSIVKRGPVQKKDFDFPQN